MKKLILSLIISIFLLLFILPLLDIILLFNGYNMDYVNPFFMPITLSALSVLSMALSLFFKEKIENKVFSVITALLPLLSILNVVYYSDGGVVTIGCSLLTFAVAFYLTSKYSKDSALRLVSTILSFALVHSVFFISLFGNIREDTVIKDLPSPNGEYYVQLIDSDQGAMGGATEVNIYESNKGIDLFLLKIQKKPKRVYTGRWGEYKNMEIYWENDNCLVINGREYKVK